MQTVDINIQLDPATDGIICSFEKVKPEDRNALIIGTNGNYRIVDEEEALSILSRMDGFGRSEYMGSTHFLVVFNAGKVIKAGDGEYIAGSVLILKSGKRGIAFMTEEEIEKAKKEFASRIVTLCADGTSFSAYEIG